MAGPNGHYIVQAVLAARVMRPFLEIGCLVDQLLNHLRCLVPDKLPVHGGPDSIVAQEEGINNEGGEARVLVERRMLVHASEPVAEKASLLDVAISESGDGPEVFEKLGEEFRLVARFLDACVKADGDIRLLQLAGLDLLHQVLHVYARTIEVENYECHLIRCTELSLKRNIPRKKMYEGAAPVKDGEMSGMFFFFLF